MDEINAPQRSDRSLGIVPLKRERGNWCAALILQGDAWTFPKGHPEVGEAPRRTAERELKEETGLTVTRYLQEDPIEESYTFRTPEGVEVFKRVEYFPALVTGSLTPQLEEVRAARWLALDDVSGVLTFASSRRVWNRVCDLLKTLTPEI